MLCPTVRRTWAPQGQTPICRCWNRRDRLSAISALSLSPVRRRLGLHFDLQDRNILTADVVNFIVRLRKRLRQPIVLVLDRWSVHRAAARHLQERFARRVQIEWLPGYAPDLNPCEQVWNRTKHTDLTNFTPDHLRQLGRRVCASLQKTRRHQSILRSFFDQAKLKP